VGNGKNVMVGLPDVTFLQIIDERRDQESEAGISRRVTKFTFKEGRKVVAVAEAALMSNIGN